MGRGIALLGLMLLWLVPGVVLAQDDEDVAPGPPPVKTYRGVSWGFTRTYWSDSFTDEGYPGAGTAGPTIELRSRRPMGKHGGLTLYGRYFWMYSTVTERNAAGVRARERRFYREIDVGANLEYCFQPDGKGFYLGMGPLIRWGNAGRRTVESGFPMERPGRQTKAAWFGLAFLGGFRTPLSGEALAFFEPQFVISPDPADRWQQAFPPNNLVMQMGVLF